LGSHTVTSTATNAASSIGSKVKVAGSAIQAPLAGTTTIIRRPGWKVGDPIDKATRLGQNPTFPTVKSRYWKNRAMEVEQGRGGNTFNWEANSTNIERMKRGSAPLDHSGKSIELHHNIPQRLRNRETLVSIDHPMNLYEVTAEQHANIDRFRHVGKMKK
jgi:hypothetical protein